MLKQRVITAAIGIPLLFLFVWLNGWWFGVILLALAAIGCYEYYRLSKEIKTEQHLAVLLSGIVYILLGFVAFFGIRQQNCTLWQLLTIWSTDTAAYFVGRKWGKRKLAPNISPNKTVEGGLGGMVAGTLVGLLTAVIMGRASFGTALWISFATSTIGQIGDLVESKVKRLSGVKDSGNIFPGHGGVLDRFDSILLSSMFMYLFLLAVQ